MYFAPVCIGLLETFLIVESFTIWLRVNLFSYHINFEKLLSIFLACIHSDKYHPTGWLYNIQFYLFIIHLQCFYCLLGVFMYFFVHEFVLSVILATLVNSVASMSSFLRTCPALLHRHWALSYPHQEGIRVPVFLYPCQHFSLSIFWIMTILVCEWELIVAFDLHIPND